MPGEILNSKPSKSNLLLLCDKAEEDNANSDNQKPILVSSKDYDFEEEQD